MPTDETIKKFDAAQKRIDDLDYEKLLRKQLGEESLEKDVLPRLDKLQKFRDLAQQYVRSVHNTVANQVQEQLAQIGQHLENQIAFDNSQFISQRTPFLKQLDALLDNVRLLLPPLVSAAVLERGFLDDEGIRQEYERTAQSFRNQAEDTLSELKEESSKILESTRQLAEQIEQRARRTAAKVSVEEAQEQFRNAQSEDKTNIILWAIMTVVTLTALVVLAMRFLSQEPKEVVWHILAYKTILRLIIFSTITAAATLSMRMLKAHMHMRQLNGHRLRVANSIESFVASAQTPEQRDLILLNMVDAVVAFGNSGILSNDDDTLGAQKMSGELVGRVASAIAPGK